MDYDNDNDRREGLSAAAPLPPSDWNGFARAAQRGSLRGAAPAPYRLFFAAKPVLLACDKQIGCLLIVELIDLEAAGKDGRSRLRRSMKTRLRASNIERRTVCWRTRLRSSTTWNMICHQLEETEQLKG